MSSGYRWNRTSITPKSQELPAKNAEPDADPDSEMETRSAQSSTERTQRKSGSTARPAVKRPFTRPMLPESSSDSVLSVLLRVLCTTRMQDRRIREDLSVAAG